VTALFIVLDAVLSLAFVNTQKMLELALLEQGYFGHSIAQGCIIRGGWVVESLRKGSGAHDSATQSRILFFG